MSYNFEELTRKLQNFSKRIILTIDNKDIEFSSKNNAIEYIFEKYGYNKDKIAMFIDSGFLDVDLWKDEIDNLQIYDRDNDKPKNDSLLNKFINLKHLKKQEPIYNKKIYNIDSNDFHCLDINKYVGICLLTSTFNAYPQIFDYKAEKVISAIEDLGEYKYDNMFEVVDYLNKKLGRKPLDKVFEINATNIGKEFENNLENILDKQIPIVYSGLVLKGYDKNGFENLEGHCVTLLGYNKDYYYIYDNMLETNSDSVFVDYMADNFASKLIGLYHKWDIKKLYRYLQQFKCESLLQYIRVGQKYIIKKKLKENNILWHNIRRDNRFMMVHKKIIYNAFTDTTYMHVNPRMLIKDNYRWLNVN